MSPRRRSGAARRAKKLAEETNNEQPTPSREVSTQQGTTVCEDEEAAPFGAEKEETQIEATHQEPQEDQAQEKEGGIEQQKPRKERRRSKSRGENVEEDESEASGNFEQDGKDSAEEEEKDPADEEQDPQDVVEGEEDKEGGKEKMEREVKAEGESEKLQDPAGAAREEEQEGRDSEVDNGEEVEVREGAEGPTVEEAKRDDEILKDIEEKEHMETEAQQHQEKQQDEEQKEKQPEDGEPQTAEIGGEPEEKVEGEEEDENEGTVAEERQGALKVDPSGSFAEWTGSDAEFSVAPSVDSSGACCVTDIAGSVCEELFISRDGFYGPRARSRVFSEAKDIVMDRIPSAMARYTEEAQNESISDACLSCTSDASDSCFPTAKLFMDVVLAGGAAVMSVLYQYRNEILKGAACLATSTFKCLQTCLCTVTPPPQEPRAVDRLPPGPWVTVGDSTEVWAPLGSGEMVRMGRMPSLQQRESMYADVYSLSSSPRQSLDALQRQASQGQGSQTAQPQGSQTVQGHYRPIIAPGTNHVIFSRRVTANN